MLKYNKLAIEKAEDLMFASAPSPVQTARGLVIGGGTVFPELNFTLPEISIEKNGYKAIRKQYRDIVSRALTRAVELELEGVILEFEALLEMTLDPDFGISIVSEMNDICESYWANRGLKSEIRLTPNDTREFDRPPLLRSGAYLENMLRFFQEGGKAGGTFLSIESTGGKEVHDQALMYGDIKSSAFALLVLGVRDMQFLWPQIINTAREAGVLPGGDTACGFANTAMVLAEKHMIPRIVAAIDRVLTVPRTLVAVESGATGPDKDCGYEGPYLKAIAGIPISMEGKSAACAHLSPLGNITAACCDLWSNESVQDVSLLGGQAPTVSLEQLAYDARLINTAVKSGKADSETLQRLFVESDKARDPQAFVLSPDVVIEVAKVMVAAPTHLQAGKQGAIKALNLIEHAWKSGDLNLHERETVYVELIREQLESIPESEEAFIEEMEPLLEENKVKLSEYGI
ncbi:MAG: methyltransferase MtaB domain-containing protein [Spirochaetota bacterium]